MKEKTKYNTFQNILLIDGKRIWYAYSKKRGLGVVLFALLLCTLTLSSQEYKIAKDAFGCGTTSMAGTEFRMIGTLSQSFIGVSEDDKNKCFAGFWNNIKEAPINVESEQIDDLIIKIFPNPFEDFIVIEFSSDKESDVELTINNLLGQNIAIIFSGKCKQGINRISFSSDRISTGVYYLQLKNKHTQKTLMVVKQ